MQNITDEQLVQLLGTISGPLGAGIVGGMVSPDRSVSSGLAAGAGSLGGSILGGGLGAIGGGALGGIGGAGLGRLLGLSDQELEALIGMGGSLGGTLGMLGGGMAGSGMGAGLGYSGAQNIGRGDKGGDTGGQGSSSEEKNDDNKQQEKEGSAMSNADNNAFAVGALEKLAEQNIDPAQFVQVAAQSNNPTMRKIASAIVAYDDEVRRTEHAFAVGAIEKLAEYNVAPAQFVQAAARSGDETMQKIASTIVNLDRAIQAQQGQEKQANKLNKAVSMIPGVRNIREGGENLMDPRRLLQDTPGDIRPADVLRNMRQEGLDEQQAEALRQLGVGAAQLGGTGLGIGGLGAGGAYLMGDSGTTGSGLQDFSNQYLGTDFDTLSRLQAMRQG